MRVQHNNTYKALTQCQVNDTEKTNKITKLRELFQKDDTMTLTTIIKEWLILKQTKQ